LNLKGIRTAGRVGLREGFGPLGVSETHGQPEGVRRAASPTLFFDGNNPQAAPVDVGAEGVPDVVSLEKRANFINGLWQPLPLLSLADNLDAKSREEVMLVWPNEAGTQDKETSRVYTSGTPSRAGVGEHGIGLAGQPPRMSLGVRS